jgi:hypothetical protein
MHCCLAELSGLPITLALVDTAWLIYCHRMEVKSDYVVRRVADVFGVTARSNARPRPLRK